MKKLLYLLVAAVVVLTGCKKDDAVKVDSVSLTPETATLEIGATQQLTAEVLPANADNKDVQWKSSADAVATVNASGLVTAIAAGSATITATTADGGKTDTSVITVNAAQQPSKPAVSDYFSVAGSTAVEGALPAKTDDSAISVAMANVEGDATKQTVTVTSPIALSKILVKVDGVDGYLEFPAVAKSRADFVYPFTIALAEAAAKTFKITVSGVTADDKVVAPASADVKTDSPYNPGPGAIAVTGVSLNKFSAQVTVGETFEFVATVAPADASNKNVTWSIEDSSVATVSNGVVTGVKAGATVLTATTEEGKFSATAPITVIAAPNPSAVKSIKFNYPALTDIAVDSITVLKIVTDPAGLESSVTLGDWKTSDADVATVTSKGVVKAIGTGTAQIYVWTADGKFKATCAVKVGAGGGAANVPVTGVTIQKSGADAPGPIAMKVGDADMTLTALVAPNGATDQTVAWSVSGDAVTVSNGVVHAVKSGSSTVTVTTTDGSKTDTIIFNVTTPVASISAAAGTSATLTRTSSAEPTDTIAVVFTPTDADNKALTYASSATAVATVDANGVVSAVAPGSATITVTATNGTSGDASDDKTATVAYTVRNTVAVVTITAPASTEIDNSDGSGLLSLTANVNADAVNNTITWSSSAPAVATVDSVSGVVSAVGDGTVTITATVSNGGADGASAGTPDTIDLTVTGTMEA